MTINATENPIALYLDIDGKPLDNGSIYFGQANQNPETAPITVYWDSAGTQPAAQPIKTVNGQTARNGTPAAVYAGSDYSNTVRNKRGKLVSNFNQASGFSFIWQLLTSVGASMVGFIQSGIGAVARTVQDWIRDRPVSVKDFGAKGDGVTDDTAAFNAAFAASNSVFAPDGDYRVGALLFGSQSIVAQSSSPRLFYGSGWGTILRAKSGFTGTILQAWSTAGIEFRDFSVDGNSTATLGIDTTWKPGAGPSTQNRYTHVRVGGINGTSWQAKDNNDAIFDQVVINSLAQGNCTLDFAASGGLGWLRDCIWNNGYLRFGVQNGSISNSWGHGISFAQGCVNYITLNGCYIYSNTAMGCVLGSQSFSAFQSIGSLTCIGTQFIGNSTAFFNLNAYSTLDFYGCEFVGATTTMFGVSCRSDSFALVKVLFRGGSVPNGLVVNQPSGFLIEQDGLMDLTTGLHRPEKRSSIYATGGSGGTFAGATYYDFIPAGTLEEGVYLITLSWSHNGAGSPFLVRSSAIVNIVSTTTGSGSGADITCTVGEYDLSGAHTMVFRLANPGTTATPKIQFKSSVALPSPGTYWWTASKVNY